MWSCQFDALEKTKATLTLDAERDKQTIEAFAAQVFDYADKADRAGNANKNTVFGFQASSVIFEVSVTDRSPVPLVVLLNVCWRVQTLQYFGPLDPEVEERIRSGRRALGVHTYRLTMDAAVDMRSGRLRTSLKH